jgi:hypothetical protein
METNMNHKEGSELQKIVKSVGTREPKIILRRAEEIFPALKGLLVSVLRRNEIYHLVLYNCCV